MRSIASRLFWTQLTASLVLAVLVGLVLYLRVKSSFVSEFDRALGGKATSLAAVMRMEPKGFHADFDKSSLPELERKNFPEYLQVTDLDQKTCYRSPSLGGNSLPFSATNRRANYADVPLPDGTIGREVVYRFQPTYDEDMFPHGAVPTAPPAPMYLTLAESRLGLDEQLHSFFVALLLAAGTMTVGIVMVTVLTMKTGLWHLIRFAYDVEQIDSEQLRGRINEQSVPAEILPVARRLNQLLSRLEAAFMRERRFTADAAHELRTPISELRALSEVALRNSAAAPGALEFFHDALDIAKQMESLVTTLLALARGQSIHAKTTPESIDLGEVAPSIWKHFQAEAAAKQLTCSWASVPHARVTADRVILLSILQNLMSNAVAHAPAGGRLDWSVATSDGSVSFCVQNSNDQLTEADLPHLAEPFWQKNSARSGKQHSGLGLALVKAWSENLHARTEFHVIDEGTIFEARLMMKTSQDS